MRRSQCTTEKTQVWNRGGVEPQDIDIITIEARIRVPGAVVWRGAQELPATRARVEGPWGSNWAPSVCARVLEAEVRRTTSSLPAHSIRERPTGKLAAVMDVRVHPGKLLAADGVSGVDVAIRGVARRKRVAMFAILDVQGAPAEAQQLASLPLTLGGLGLASAERTRHVAHWASWADCLAMVQQRHPSVAEEMIVGLDRDLAPCLAAARHCKEVLAEANFHPPGWRDLVMVVPDRVEEVEPNSPSSVGNSARHGVWRPST